MGIKHWAVKREKHGWLNTSLHTNEKLGLPWTQDVYLFSERKVLPKDSVCKPSDHAQVDLYAGDLPLRLLRTEPPCVTTKFAIFTNNNNNYVHSYSYREV